MDNNRNMAEYERLANEMNLRLNILYTNNSAVITTMVMVWTLIVSSLAGFLVSDNMLIDFKTLGQDIGLVWIVFGIALLIGILFSIPIAILFPIAAKDRDNLFQIFHIGSFMKFCYEEDCDFYWESVQGEAFAHRYGKWNQKGICREYFVIGVINISVYSLYSLFSSIFLATNLLQFNSLIVFQLCIYILMLLIILAAQIYFVKIIFDFSNLSLLAESAAKLEKKEIENIQRIKQDRMSK